METKKYIKKLKKNFIKITTQQEKEILKYFGNNISNEFTEQDIWEQTRKTIEKYEKNKI